MPSCPGEIRIRAVVNVRKLLLHVFESQDPTNFTGHSHFVAPPKEKRFGMTFLLVFYFARCKSRLERVS